MLTSRTHRKTNGMMNTTSNLSCILDILQEQTASKTSFELFSQKKKRQHEPRFKILQKQMDWYFVKGSHLQQVYPSPARTLVRAFSAANKRYTFFNKKRHRKKNQVPMYVQIEKLSFVHAYLTEPYVSTDVKIVRTQQNNKKCTTI